MVILETVVLKSATVAMEIFVPRKMVTARRTVLLAGMEPAARMVKFACFIAISVVTVAGICNSVGGGVLFNIPPWWRWRISVQYAPCIAGEGQSSVPFPSPHASSCHTRQLPPLLLIIRRRDAIVTAVVCVTDHCDVRLVNRAQAN